MADTQQQQQGTPAAPVPGSPEHDAAMIAKFNAAQGTPPADPEPQQNAAGEPGRPEWLPAKFKSPEDLAKAYAELEARLGGKPAQSVPPKPEAGKGGSEGGDKSGDKEPPKAIDFEALAAEVGRDGNISEDSRAALRKAGIPDAVIDLHVSTLKAQVEARLSEIKAEMVQHVGSVEEYERILEWGAKNFSDAEKAAFNAQVNAGGEARAIAAQMMKARYEAANGKAPNLLGGKAGNGIVGYASVAEMTADMKDKRYKDDPAFRKQVEQKIAATTAF